MHVLLLGVGMQGKLALHDLAQSDGVTKIVAADRDIEGLAAFTGRMRYGDRVQYAAVDASDTEAVGRLLKGGVDVVIDLLPPQFIDQMAECAVRHGVHYLNTFFVTSGLKELAHAAGDHSVALLPEFGLDPGIDLVLLAKSARQFDRVFTLNSYCGGFPEKKR